MESLEKARERAYRRYSNDILDPVKINNLNDIKIVLTELDPNKNKQSDIVRVSADIEVKDNGATELHRVYSDTRSKSKRDQLVEGFELIRKRIESVDSVKNLTNNDGLVENGIKPISTRLLSNSDGVTWLDPLIRQWLGGYRSGMYVMWNISSGTYKYDIFSHKLTRVIDDSSSDATSGTVQK